MFFFVVVVVVLFCFVFSLPLAFCRKARIPSQLIIIVNRSHVDTCRKGVNENEYLRNTRDVFNTLSNIHLSYCEDIRSQFIPFHIQVVFQSNSFKASEPEAWRQNDVEKVRRGGPSPATDPKEETERIE